MESKISTYYRLLRGTNLIFIILTMYILRYFLIAPLLRVTNNIPSMGDDLFHLLVLATTLIAAAGYVINDYYDQVIDGINKSSKQIVGVKVSAKAANNLFWVFIISASLIGVFISFMIRQINLGSIFIITSFMVYYYSLKYKRLLLWGNIVVALLSGLVILMPWLFEFFAQVSYPQTFIANYQSMNAIRQISFLYFAFALITTLIREWIKDIEDMNGDRQGGRISLPIKYGVKQTKLIILATIGVAILGIGVLQTLFFINSKSMFALYSLATITAPLLYLASKLWKSESKEEYHFCALISKIIMALGILFLVIANYASFAI